MLTCVLRAEIKILKKKKELKYKYCIKKISI